MVNGRRRTRSFATRTDVRSRSWMQPESRCRITSAIPRRMRAALSNPSEALSVISMHNCGWVFVQATVAILILVGFESVTSMGGEAKNAKRDVPIAVIVSLLVQGCFVTCSSISRQIISSTAAIRWRARRLGGADRRHDDRGRRCFVRRGPRTHLHAGGGVHGVSGADRHHALLHEHRSARHLRDGQGQEVPEHSACCTPRT